MNAAGQASPGKGAVHQAPVPKAPARAMRVHPGLLQRKCACGGSPGVDGECAECRQKRLSMKRVPLPGPRREASEDIPPIVFDVLRSPGRPLDPGTREFMEPRFGHDFGRVRVHADTRAAESARAVNALAYTVNQDIVFGSGQYNPSNPSGRNLLAHELTHVVQQQAGGTGLAARPVAIGDEHDLAEEEADAIARRVTSGETSGSISARPEPNLRRRVAVVRPGDNIPNPGGRGVVQTNAETVRRYLTTICSGGSVTVDRGSGAVGINSSFCTSPALPRGAVGPRAPSPALSSTEPTGCSCLCDLVNSTHIWRIRVDDTRWPHTDPDDRDAGAGRTPGGTGGEVTTPSPNSPKLWGAATTSGTALNIDPWLVLGHELCGHGWLSDRGMHGPDEASPRGEGGHQRTVERENLLRREHGIDLRGTFKDPNCGESFWRDRAAPGTVNWSSYHSICAAWRADYNRRHGTSYTITDRIP
jgi:Domain of unknown function (DUF4157)